MRREWLGNNDSGLAIVRISSRRQEGNISHETQEKEIREYCALNRIRLESVIQIVESAKDSEDRKKYTRAISHALTEGIRHLLFYMYDREARNLTDNEKNEKLVKAGLIVIHYVRENKVLHDRSPDSEFFIRDVQAAANKQFIRNLSAKVSDAMRQKAENGWYPSNNVPLGYAIAKLKDERGKELKRGSTVIVDPNERNVRQVVREFELRAEGYSYQDIRDQVIAEGLVDPERLHRYNKATIEKRIHNPFYTGRFHWQGKDYDGKHEVFIPSWLMEAAQRGRTRRISDNTNHGVFAGGWLRCAECGCHIVYDPKKKVNKQGGVRFFHYYRCSNGRRVHQSLTGMNVPEAWIWKQFESVIESLAIPEELAAKIADALNVTERQAMREATAGIEKSRLMLKTLEEREDRAYEDMIAGVLDHEGFRRQVQRLRAERSRLTNQIQAFQAQLSGKSGETARSIIELCKSLKSLYLSRSAAEKRDLLEKLVSNPVLERQVLRYDLKKPYASLANINNSEEWRTLIDDYRTDVAALEVDNYLGRVFQKKD